MPENYKKVVNLQSNNDNNYKLKQETQPSVRKKIKKSKAEEIDRVYNEKVFDGSSIELDKIDRPKKRETLTEGIIYKQLFFVLLAIVLLVSFWYFVIKNEKSSDFQGVLDNVGDWYSVQLVSGDVFYGFVKNTSADPVVLEKVYYNYNQSAEDEGTDATGSIRLVKRGKESHGPDGSMEIVRSQVLLMEKLGDESKIKRAIVDYEK